MFSGIVQACVPIASLAPGLAGMRMGLALPPPLREGLVRGASVAVDGVCLTATDMDGDVVYFDAVPGTLARTNLGTRDAGQRVNVERSLVQGAEIGGHPVSGHIAGTAAVIDLRSGPGAAWLDFLPPEDMQKYIFPRGFIALNGCSLTVAEIDDMGICRINLIPETLRLTSFPDYRPGDRINVEPDAQTIAIVDTVERIMARPRARGR
jgi:riboflavin synthase